MSNAEHSPLPPTLRVYVDSLPTSKPGRGKNATINGRRQNERGYAEACALSRLGLLNWPDLRPALYDLSRDAGGAIQQEVNRLLTDALPDLPRADWRLLCRCGASVTVPIERRPTEQLVPASCPCPECGQALGFYLTQQGTVFAYLTNPAAEPAE